MIRLSRTTTLIFTSAALLHPTFAPAGDCQDAEFCAEPCPAENSCLRHEDCLEGQVCNLACLPPWCFCDPVYRSWACSDNCAGECVPRFGPAGPLSYVLTELGTLGGYFSGAWAINNAGQVVGWADRSDGARHAFLWDHGTMIDLGTPEPGDNSFARDINDVGQIVIHTGGFAYLWDNGTTQLISGLGPSGKAFAFALNNAGQVVGTSEVRYLEPRAFLWEDGVTHDLTAEGLDSSIASGINDAGCIVGGGSIWDEGTLTELGALGPFGSGGLAINDLKQVVGVSRMPPDDYDPFLVHAFLWDEGVMTDIGQYTTLRHSEAVAINNLGQVVGLQMQNGFVYYGFLYDSEAGMRNLHDLIPHDGPWWYWHRLDPQDINDAGQIVGHGTFMGLRRAFLMTPIDADFDDDGGTDLVDYELFRSCLTGPSAPAAPACTAQDVNRNGHVDLDDFRAFLWHFAEP